MVVRAVSTLFTRADWDRLPEGFPAQLIHGWLVRDPAPTYGHQRLQTRLFAALLRFVREDRLVAAPSDVGIDDYNVFQPDLLVLRTAPKLAERDVGIPLVAIEILSPSTAKRDRGVKRRRLIAAGTAEVWIVDPETHSVERHDGAGCATAFGAETLASKAIPGFEVVPARLFAVGE
jgi:Uma2 family endonuclease